MQRHPDFDAQPILRIVRGCSILNAATQHPVNIEQIEILTLAPTVDLSGPLKGTDMSPRPKYFREQAAVCRRIASGLSWNSSGHLQFLEMAEGFEKSAAELESDSVIPREVGESRLKSLQEEAEKPASSEKPDATS